MNFDDQPVGQHSKIEIPEQPPSLPSVSAAAPSASISERLLSKNSKLRLEAATELLKKFSSATDSDPLFTEHYPTLLHNIGDPHPGVQEKALDCLLLLLRKSPPRTDIPELLSTILERALVSAKSSVKSKAVDCLLTVTELEGSSAVRRTLLSVLGEKTSPPKIVCAALQSLTRLLSEFGNDVFPVREALSLVVVQTGSANPTVRGEAMGYLREGYRWVPVEVVHATAGLKPAQQEELKRQFAEGKENTAPPVPTRKAKGMAEGKSAAPIPTSSDIVKPPEETKKEPAPEQGTRRFDSEWCRQLLAMKKWSEKRDRLEELIRATDMPEIKVGEDFAELGQTLKKLISDSNIVVSNLALKAVGQLAKALGPQLVGYAKNVFLLVAQKCRDRKSAPSARKCLESLALSLRVEDLLDELKEALADKSPLVKAGICDWLQTVVLPRSGEPSTAKLVSAALGPTLIRLTEDAVEEVRDSALTCLGVLKGLAGDPGLDRAVQGMKNTQKQQRILRAAEQASHPKAEPDTGATLQQPEAVNVTDEEETKAIDQPKEKTNKKSTRTTKELTVLVEDVGEPLGPEEAEKMIALAVPSEIVHGLNGGAKSDWKERQKRLHELGEWIARQPSPVTPDFAEALAAFLKRSTKEFRESNVNLMRETISVISALAATANLTKRFACIVVPAFAERLGDPKLAESCLDLLMAIGDSATPAYVGTISMKVAACGAKSPATVRGVLALLGRMAHEFDARLIPVGTAVEFARWCLSHANSQVRAAASKCISTLYEHIGESIKPLIGEMSETVSQELAKVQPRGNAAEPKRQVRGEAKELLARKNSADLADTLVPRANISAQITSKLIESLEDPSMKKRQEAKESLEKILASAGARILPNGLGALVTALRGRMSEPCRNLARGFIALVGNLAVALGPACRQYQKALLRPMMGNLADKQASIRGETVTAIERFAEACGGHEVVINNAGPLLEKDNPEMRTELLGLIIKNKESLAKSDVGSLVGAIVAAMQDRSKEIRLLAEQVAGEMVSLVGLSAFEGAIKDLKPSVRADLQRVLAKFGPVVEAEEEEKEKKKKKEDESSAAAPEQTPNDADTENRIATEPVEEAAQRKTSANLGPPLDFATVLKTECSQSGSDSASPKVGRKPSAKTRQSHRSELLKSSTRLSGDDSGTPRIESILVGQPPSKEKRAEAEKNSRWPVGEVREDYVAKLKKSLRFVIHPNAFECMFSSDFRKNMEAIRLLTEAAKHDFPSMVHIADLVFKWLTLKMAEQCGPVMNKRIVDFLGFFFSELCQTRKSLLDFEAASILPMICERLGCSNPALREEYKRLLRKACEVHGGQKVATYVVRGMESKNPKTRAECTGFLRELVATYSVGIITTRDVKTMSRMFAAGDASVRGEAAELLCEVFRQKGDRVWQYVGELPEKAAGLLKLRFQQVAAEKLWETTEEKGARSESEKNVLVGIGTESEESKKGVASAGRSPSPKQPLEQCLESLRAGDIARKVDALASLNEWAGHASKVAAPGIVQKGNTIFSTFASALKEIFEHPPGDIPVRLAKYLTLVLNRYCTIRPMVSHLSEDIVGAVMSQLLSGLRIEEGIVPSTEEECIRKSLNDSAIRLMENADPTRMFVALFGMLRNHKEAEIRSLTVKCIARLGKAMSALLDVGKLLRCMHEYLQENIKGDELGATAVKMVLKQLGSTTDISKEYSKTCKTPNKRMERWIAEIIRPLPPARREASGTTELREIFEGLNSQSTFEEAIKSLGEYMRRHPKADLTQYFASCSHAFREFIFRALEDAGQVKGEEQQKVMRQRLGIADRLIAEEKEEAAETTEEKEKDQYRTWLRSSVSKK